MYKYNIGDRVIVIKPTLQTAAWFSHWLSYHEPAVNIEHEITSCYMNEWYTLKPGGTSNIGFNEAWLQLVIAKTTPSTLLCVCPLNQLMNRGCLCGGFKKGA